jgi:tetratricopeptide (TPR) repeat protein
VYLLFTFFLLHLSEKNTFMKKLLFTLFFCSLSLSLSAQSWQELTEKGMQAYQAGSYKEATSYLEKALKQVEKEFGKNHENYATSCNNLASLYYNQGRYAEAEPLFKEALAIRAKVLGKEHPDYATSCNNLALLYEIQGRYAEAEPLFKEAKEIYAKVLGKEHPDYASSCINLALLLYDRQGLYAEAEPLLKEAKEIFGKVLGKEHPDYAQSCNNLAVFYYEQGRYAEAEPLYKEALAIRAKVLGKEHPDYATSCNNLALLYDDQERYAEAEPLYKEAKEIYAKVLGKEHPEYATPCNNLALLYDDQGRYAEAEPLLKEASQTLITNIRRNFVGLSEKEKEQYLATFKDDFEGYFSFALKAQKPELYGWLLENTMITKGLLFFSTSQLRRTLENLQDASLKQQYQNWIEKRKIISKAYELTIAQRKEKNINLEALEKEANELEKQLSASLSAKGIQAELTPTPRSWKEIQQKLKENEALVEMVRVRYYDKKWTDSILYLAMVVKKNSLSPEIVVFANGKEMEQGDINVYRNSVKFRKTDKESYKVFFKPLE